MTVTSAQHTLNLLETRVHRCVADVTASISADSSTIDITYDTTKSKTSLASLGLDTTSRQSCSLQLVFDKFEGAGIENVITTGIAKLDDGVKATVDTMVVWDTREAPVGLLPTIVALMDLPKP